MTHRHRCAGKRGSETYRALIEALERGLLREQVETRDGKPELTYSAVVPHQATACKEWLEVRNPLKKLGAVSFLMLLEHGVVHAKLMTSGGSPDAGFFHASC